MGGGSERDTAGSCGRILPFGVSLHRSGRSPHGKPKVNANQTSIFHKSGGQRLRQAQMSSASGYWYNPCLRHFAVFNAKARHSNPKGFMVLVGQYLPKNISQKEIFFVFQYKDWNSLSPPALLSHTCNEWVPCHSNCVLNSIFRLSLFVLFLE